MVDKVITFFPLEPKQQDIIFFVPMVFAILSFLCDINVIYTILRESNGVRTLLRSPGYIYERIIFGMAFFDMINSSSWALSTLPAPSDHPWGIYAQGNRSTCNVQGFLAQFSTCVIFYNASLCKYFMLSLKDGGGSQISSRVEAMFHSLPILFGLITATLWLILIGYNIASLSNHCFLSSFPGGCTQDEDDDLIRCTLKKNASRDFLLIVAFWVFCVYVYVIYAMTKFYSIMRRQIVQSHYSPNVIEGPGSRIIRSTAKLGIVYVTSFALTIILPAMLTLEYQKLTYKGNEPIKTSHAVAWALFSLVPYLSQGALYCIIFHYRRYTGRKLSALFTATNTDTEGDPQESFMTSLTEENNTISNGPFSSMILSECV